MHPSNLDERPSRTGFGRLMAEALRTKGRIIHSSGVDGIYVKASQAGRIHRLELEYYSIGSRSPLLLRMNVNRSSFDIPKTLARKWRLLGYGRPFQSEVGLEVTFLPQEAESISAWVPTLIETMEIEGSGEWSRGFPFHVSETSPTNLWTAAANEFANECVRANGSLISRRLA